MYPKKLCYKTRLSILICDSDILNIPLTRVTLTAMLTLRYCKLYTRHFVSRITYTHKVQT